jgi:hypothetical protein
VRSARAAALAALSLATAASITSVARGDGPGPSDANLRDYYGGERLSAYVIGGTAAAAASSGAYLATRDGAFSRALGWSWVGLGGFELVGAVAYALQVGAETDHYEAALARDPAAYRSEESDHLRGTASRFVIYRSVELAMVVGGTGALVYAAASGADAWKGAGLGVLTLSLPLAIIDTINNARTSRYLEQLAKLSPALAVQGGQRGPVYTLSLGAAF